MPLDPSIPLQVRPMQVQPQANMLAQAMQMQNMQQQNALASMQMRHGEADYQRGEDFRSAFANGTPDESAMMRADPMRALAFQKQKAEASKVQAETEHSKALTAGLAITQKKDALSLHLDQLPTVTDIPSLTQWMTAAVKDGVYSPERANAEYIELTRDPSKLDAWRQRTQLTGVSHKDQLEMVAPKPEKMTDGQRTWFVDQNPRSPSFGKEIGAPKVQLQADPNAVLSSNTQIKTTGMQVASSARGQDITARGQDITDTRQREANDINRQQGNVPSGYRLTPTGDLEAIAGGPADVKKQGVLNQDTATLTNSTSSMDRLASAANEAMNHPGLKGVTGIRGAIPNIPGSAAADAQALMNTLKSQVAFGVLQDMRNNSKSGGALGNVSDAEGKRLEANLAALEKAQSYDQMKSSLKKIIDYTEGAKGRLREAYNLKHGDQPASSPVAPSSSVLRFDAQGNPVK